MRSNIAGRTRHLKQGDTVPLNGAAQAAPAHPASLVNRAMLRSASIVAGAFVASRILGLIREVILAHQFGTGPALDAYAAAFRIPDLLFLVIMAGSFGSAFVPVFAGFLSHGQRDKAWALASATINVAAVSIVVTAILAFIFAEPLVRYLVVPGYPPATRELTVHVMRILLLSPIFLGLGIASKGILEAQDQFLLPAIAPLLYNLAIIFAALFLSGPFGITGVAWGVAVGAIAHFSVQIPGLIRSGMHYRPGFNLQTEGLREVGKLLLPRVVGQAAFQFNFIIVTNLASGTGTGHVIAINDAWQLLMLPHGVLALSISTVVFPTMARLFEHGQISELQRTLASALRPLLFLTLPASVGLLVFRWAIVRVILQHGAFNDHSTSLVTPALALLAAGLVGYAIVEILTRVYYAMHDTRTPVIVGVSVIVLNIIIGKALLGPMGYVGLALALSASTGVEALSLLLILRRRLGGLAPELGPWLVRVFIATGVMGLASFATRELLDHALIPGRAPLIVQVILFLYALGMVAAVYFVTAFYLRIPELDQILDRATRRFPRVADFIATLR